MASYSSSSNSSDNSEEESNTPPRKPRFIHSWSSSCRDKLKPRLTGPVTNSFKNDGSFLEMFKKMQEQNSKNTNDLPKSPAKNEEEQSASNSVTTGSNTNDDSSTGSKINRHVGKRRTARVLPTGLVKKQRKGEQLEPPAEAEEQPKVERKNDPWSKYMDEVKKYKQQSCTDEDSTRRPLVK